MKLRSLHLDLEPGAYPAELRSEFLFRCCYVRHYVQRIVRARRVETEGYNTILVRGRPSADRGPAELRDKFLIQRVQFDHAAYEALPDHGRHEFFVAMLESGYVSCAEHHDIPLELLFAALDAFRADGFENEWVHQKKRFREAGVTARLACSMDTERFRLRLLVEGDGRAPHDALVLETPPDELCFHHKFKELRLDDGAIVVVDRLGKVVHRHELGSA